MRYLFTISKQHHRLTFGHREDNQERNICCFSFMTPQGRTKTIRNCRMGIPRGFLARNSISSMLFKYLLQNKGLKERLLFIVWWYTRQKLEKNMSPLSNAVSTHTKTENCTWEIFFFLKYCAILLFPFKNKWCWI